MFVQIRLNPTMELRISDVNDEIMGMHVEFSYFKELNFVVIKRIKQVKIRKKNHELKLCLVFFRLTFRLNYKFESVFKYHKTSNLKYHKSKILNSLHNCILNLINQHPTVIDQFPTILKLCNPKSTFKNKNNGQNHRLMMVALNQAPLMNWWAPAPDQEPEIVAPVVVLEQSHRLMIPVWTH